MVKVKQYTASTKNKAR